MATVRDPAFWKRFSTAVHLNDIESGSTASGKQENDISWLARQEKKKKRRAIICWSVWFATLAFAAGIVITVIILANDGVFAGVSHRFGTSGGSGDPVNN